MKDNKFDIVFAVMAVQEVVFFTPIAKRLRDEKGLSVAFLTFHEAGDDILERQGIPYFSLHKMRDSLGWKDCDSGELKEVESKLGVDISKLVIHEMLTTNRTNKRYLISKVLTYSAIINKIFEDNNIGCVVQELGGFIAPQMLYYISKYHNTHHIFIEPAMFPKRIVFTLNSIYADIPNYGKGKPINSEEQKKFIEQYKSNKTTIIPKKDRHFFQDMTFRRILSLDNFKRLLRKLYHKYILGRREEYNAILWYVVYHLIKLFRRKLLHFYYSHPVEGEKYIYYPFHVPLDVQLTVRCPEFLNQEAIVKYIAQCVPSGHKLYIKEHPAAIGGYSIAQLKDALKSEKVRLIHPRYNSFDLIKNSNCVVTVNSKVGFEAIIQGKPVVVLGKVFYRGKGVTVDADNLENLPNAVLKAIDMVINDAPKDYFLSQSFRWSYKGELYENGSENIENFYYSLKDFMVKCGIVKNHQFKRDEGLF